MNSSNAVKQRPPAPAFPAAAASVLFITIMVLAAELSGEPDIMFPVAAALTIGGRAARRQPWIVSRPKMWCLMAAVSLAGVCAACYSPLPKAVNVSLMFAVISVRLLSAGATFFPVFAAGILPIMLGIRTFVYPLSVITLVTCVALVQRILESRGLREPNPSGPWPRDLRKEGVRFFLLWILVTACAVLTIRFRVPFMIAPPLLVGTAQLSDPESPAARRSLHCWLLLSLCGAAGAYLRLLLCFRLGMPAWLAAAVVMTVALALVYLLNLYLPPAGATAILPFLIPRGALLVYPVEVAAGFAILCLASSGIRRVVRAVRPGAQEQTQ